jgi:hypothetical protein
MSHDQLFKELLRLFFAEFLELFFPDVARQLDFTRVNFINTENFKDFPEGGALHSDVAAEVRALTPGDDTPAIVHVLIEVEGQRTERFPGRMWEYYSVWRLRRRQRVFPIVVYLSPGTGGIVEEEYSERLFGRQLLTFRYAAVGLPDLRADDYRQSANPLSVALSATMRPSAEGRLAQKFDALLRIARSRLEEGQKLVLATVVESYLKLNAAEDAAFREALIREGGAEVGTFVSIYEERGIEIGLQRGIEQGLQEGLLQGQQNFLLKQLRSKFGELTETVVAQVKAMTAEQLDAVAERVLTATTIEELNLPPVPATEDKGE